MKYLNKSFSVGLSSSKTAANWPWPDDEQRQASDLQLTIGGIPVVAGYCSCRDFRRNGWCMHPTRPTTRQELREFLCDWATALEPVTVPRILCAADQP